MDKDGDGELTRLEFLEFFVVKLKLCTVRQLDKIKNRFDQIEQERTARARVLGLVEKVRKLTNPELAVGGWGQTKGELIRRGNTLEEEYIKEQDTDTYGSIKVGRTPSQYRSSNKDARKVQQRKTNRSSPLSSSLVTIAESKENESNESKLNVEFGEKQNSREPEDTASTASSSSESSCNNDQEQLVEYERNHPLSAVIAHIRRASELARLDVDNNIQKGNTGNAKASVRLLRDLITLLHSSQSEILPRLEEDDPERRRIN